MLRPIAAILATLALLAVGLVAAPAVAAGDPCYHGFEIPPRSEGAVTRIKVAPCAFAPTVTHVAVGSTVTFFNGPDVVHLVTGANAEWGSRDTELQPGQTVSYRFDTPGIYPYACALHRGMSGAIVVGDAAAAVGGASTAGTATSSGSGAGVGPGQSWPAPSARSGSSGWRSCLPAGGTPRPSDHPSARCGREAGRAERIASAARVAAP